MTELSRDAQSLIAAACDGDNPTDADRSRVRAAVLAHVAAGGAALSSAEAAKAATTAGAAKATVATGGLLAKLLAGALLVSGLAIGGYAMLGGGDSEPKQETPAPVATAPAKPAPPTSSPAAPPTAARTAVEPTSDEPATPVLPRSTRSENTPPAKAQPRIKRTRKRPAQRPRTPAAKPSHVAPNPAASLLAEKQLISGANAALRRGDARGALTLLQRHAKEHPRGMLAANRNGARVLALCKLGKAAQSRREATRFLARWSKHPMAERVRRACAKDSD